MQNIVNIPGYKAYEYLLVLNPHEDLRNKIMHIKQTFYEKYKSSIALFSKPHVALVSFTQYQINEERLINRLKTIAMGFKPVKIELRDYGSFPAHTIYIHVVSKLPIQNLVKQIRTEAQKLMKFDDEHKPHFMLEPYITIARKLQPWQYEKGWLEFSHRHFTGRFIADAMLLLKRPVGEIKYEIAARFGFENLDVGVAQGALF
ncbi:MAG: 2'-5' RNA ligase family protein [Ferruginibacter sp.]